MDAHRQPPQGGGRRAAKARIEVRRHIGGRQQLERDLLAQPLRLQFLVHATQRVIGDRHLDRPEGADHQQSGRLATPGNTSDQVDGGRIAPLQVLEHEHQRAAAREDLERVGHLAQHAGGHCAHRAIAAPLCRGVRGECRQLRHPRRRVPSQRFTELTCTVVACQTAERFENREIRLALSVLLEALPARHTDAARLHLLDEPIDEGRLADPRLTGDEHDRPRAGHRLSQARMEPGEILLAPDHRRAAGRRPRAR